MSRTGNNIDAVEIRGRSLSAVEAELWVTVTPEVLTAQTELRGRLVGPRCRFATTVEVAHPVSPFARPLAELPGRTARVVIPEPSLWEPESPFLYEGSVELWEGNKCCDRAQVRHGLRHLQLTPRGLRVNGRLLPLRGTSREPATDEEALELRRAGCNLLLVGRVDGEACDRADRVGFLMMQRPDFAQPNPDVWPWDYPQRRGGHPSAFAWLLPERTLAHDLARWTAEPPASREAPLLGIEVTVPPAQPLPRGVDFVCCREELLPRLGDVHRPKIVLTRSTPGAAQEAALAAAAPGLLGWVAE